MLATVSLKARAAVNDSVMLPRNASVVARCASKRQLAVRPLRRVGAVADTHLDEEIQTQVSPRSVCSSSTRPAVCRARSRSAASCVALEYDSPALITPTVHSTATGYGRRVTVGRLTGDGDERRTSEQEQDE